MRKCCQQGAAGRTPTASNNLHTPRSRRRLHVVRLHAHICLARAPGSHANYVSIWDGDHVRHWSLSARWLARRPHCSASVCNRVTAPPHCAQQGSSTDYGRLQRCPIAPVSLSRVPNARLAEVATDQHAQIDCIVTDCDATAQPTALQQRKWQHKRENGA